MSLRRFWPGASFRRVFLIQCVAMAVGWAVWIVNYWWQYTRVAGPEVSSLKSDLGVVAQSIADVAALTRDDGARAGAIDERLRGLHRGYRNMLRMETDAFGYVLWPRDGQALIERGASARWWSTAAPDAAEQREGRLREDDAGRAIFTLRRVSADGRYVAGVAVRQEALDAQLGLLLRATLVPTMWILPFLLPTTLLIAWIATLPVRRLAAAIGGRDAADLQPLREDRASAEFAPVTLAVNRWLGALRTAREAEARSRERERVFFANAAHELRTPLAAIGAHAHTLQRGGGGADTAAALGASVGRMTGLLDKLLLLARLDAQAHTDARTSIDLAALLRERIAAFVPRALRKDQALALDAPDAAPWLGQAEAMHSVIDNLVENALRYTPRRGRIDVSLAGDTAGWRLTIDDSGPGIDAALRERVFERFFRVGGEDEPGTGLGLAIVRESVMAQGGSITLGDSPLGGLRAMVTLRR